MSFQRDSLPDPAFYFAGELEKFKASQHRATGLCPFHNERTPSFTVNLNTGGWVCYGCNERGSDILAFHRLKYGLGFKQAAKELGAWR